YLKATADAEDGNTRLARLLEEREVCRVASLIQFDARVGSDRLSISPRIDIAPAAQNQPVELPFRNRSRLGDLHLAPLETRFHQRPDVVVLLTLGRVAVEGEKDAHVEILRCQAIGVRSETGFRCQVSGARDLT